MTTPFRPPPDDEPPSPPPALGAGRPSAAPTPAPASSGAGGRRRRVVAITAAGLALATGAAWAVERDGDEATIGPSPSPSTGAAPSTTVDRGRPASAPRALPADPVTPTTHPTTTAPAPPPTAPGAGTTSAPVPAAGEGVGTGADEPTAAAAHGWRLLAADEFDGTSVDTGRWDLYDSVGNGGVGLRRPSAISQSGGTLRITARGDVSGGMSWTAASRTYGRWEFRARSERGSGYAPAILLWPTSGNWPEEGEVDVMEIVHPDRAESHFTLHWGAENSQAGHATRADFSAWHTFAVEWAPDHVTFFLDGQPQYTNSDPAAIPDNPMHIAVQQDVGPYNDWIPGRTEDTPAEVSLHVDWVRIYAP